MRYRRRRRRFVSSVVVVWAVVVSVPRVLVRASNALY